MVWTSLAMVRVVLQGALQGDWVTPVTRSVTSCSLVWLPGLSYQNWSNFMNFIKAHEAAFVIGTVTIQIIICYIWIIRFNMLFC